MFTVSCLAIRALLYRSGASTEMAFGHVRSTVGPPPRDSRPSNSLARRGTDYFGMSSAAEFILAAVLLGLLTVLNVLNVLRQTVNSDEPQHLHTIWGWTRGFVQYRDIFDNHMPLFHILFAPIFGIIGERPTILLWMRFALLPMYFVSAWSTYQIGTRLFSRRAGLWALLGVGFFSGYYPDATDFRPNNLWLPIWLLCVATLVRGTINVRRALVAGLLLGLCFGVSMKSAVFLVSLLLSAPLALVLVDRKNRWPALVQHAAVFLAGTMLIPTAIMIFFACKGVWHDFRYGVFDFNFLADRVYKSHVVYKSHPAIGIIIFAMVLPIVVYVARWIIRASHDPDVAFRRVFVLFVCSSYFVVLQIFWPPISRTYPPIYPLAFVLCGGALLAFSEELARRRGGIYRIFPVMPLPAFVALAEFFFLLGTHPFLKKGTKNESELLRDILALTEPNDYVLDCKGETVFRRRCSPLIMERITIKSVQRGLLIDDAPRRCVETQTCVVAVIALRRFSELTRQFVERNYLPVSNTLRVAGQELKPSLTNPNRCDFNVVIPASYKIVSRDGTASGTLDGMSYDGARFLAAGPHTFESTSISDELICLWTQAVDRNFTPFLRRAPVER